LIPCARFSEPAPERPGGLERPGLPFTRRPPALDAGLAQRLAGTYETPDGLKFQVAARPGGLLYVLLPGQPDQRLIPYKGLKFRVQEFADETFEFVEESGQITSLKQADPSGEYVFKRK
jgi:hypothetical protein